MLAGSRSRIPTHSILAALGAAALLAMAPGPAAAQPGAAPGSLSPARLSRVDEVTAARKPVLRWKPA